MPEQPVDWKRLKNLSYQWTLKVCTAHLDDEIEGLSDVDVVLRHWQRVDETRASILREMKLMGL